MMQQTEKEKKNKQMGAIISVGTHIVIFFIFLFVVAWRAPDPPLPEIGIELNFGLDEAGSGEEQPEPFTTPAELDSDEDAAPDGMEEVPEEVVEDQTPVEETSEPVTEPVESTEQPTEEVVNTNDSPDVVEEIPVTEDKKEEVKEPEVKTEEAPKLPPVLYPNNKPGAGGNDGDANNVQNANNGDDSDEVGDKGDKDGKVNEKALYGNAGGGGGSSELKMSGWMWDSKPNPIEKSDESGILIIEFEIDTYGNVFLVKTLESGVSRIVAQKYENAVRKLTFSKTGGSSVARTSIGTITFKIKAK